MSEILADLKEDIFPVEDRGESIGLMEPLVLSEDSNRRPALSELAFELAQKSAAFRAGLPESMVASLATLVRSMNCYYSNLIEGHDTHPIEIERALKNDYSADPKKRDLQLEAKAHIAVQQWIDEGGIAGRVLASETFCEIHRRFFAELPEELMWVENPETKERIRITPGVLRHRDIQVGRHVAISPGAVPRFLTRYEDAYGRLGKAGLVLAAAAAHHRLAWIHPFLDGNGRVIRLASHALLLEALGTGAVWSVSRGLARNVDAYKAHLARCDYTKRNDLDGRGHLSEEELASFTEFFLRTCIDQVTFMEELMQPATLRTRIQLWAEEQVRLGKLPAKSGKILDALLYRGELPRAEVATLLDVVDRHARRFVEPLTAMGVVVSEGPRAPLRLAFPAALASRWMPGLFPDMPA
jgi:Fic family protein